MRFKRQLEEMKSSEKMEVTMDKSMPEEVTAEPHHYDAHPPKENGPQPEPVHDATPTEKPHTGSNGHAEHHKDQAGNAAHQTMTEKVRQMLVNNYRPVQPLNGRVIYRSFPFFDEPIRKDTEVVYIEKPVAEDVQGSATLASVSLFTVVCSFLLTVLF